MLVSLMRQRWNIIFSICKNWTTFQTYMFIVFMVNRKCVSTHKVCVYCAAVLQCASGYVYMTASIVSLKQLMNWTRARYASQVIVLNMAMFLWCGCECYGLLLSSVKMLLICIKVVQNVWVYDLTSCIPFWDSRFCLTSLQANIAEPVVDMIVSSVCW